MTSRRHSKQRKELNKKRTVAILNLLTYGLSQKCNDFQHDHGQLLVRSGLSTNILGTSMSDRVYQLIKAKDSLEHHKIVNEWIDLAIKQKRLPIINIDDYTSVHTKKRPIKGTSQANKMCTILLKKIDVEAVECDIVRPVNNPEGIVVEDLVRNMSSNEEVKKLCFSTLVQCCEENAPWIVNNFFDSLYEEERLRTHDYAVDTQMKKKCEK